MLAARAYRGTRTALSLPATAARFFPVLFPLCAYSPSRVLSEQTEDSRVYLDVSHVSLVACQAHQQPPKRREHLFRVVWVHGDRDKREGKRHETEAASGKTLSKWHELAKTVCCIAGSRKKKKQQRPVDMRCGLRECIDVDATVVWLADEHPLTKGRKAQGLFNPTRVEAMRPLISIPKFLKYSVLHWRRR